MTTLFGRPRTVLLALVVVVACVVWFRSVTPEHATRLFSVELSFTPGGFAESMRGWIAPGPGQPPTVDELALRTFRLGNIGVDFLFIPAYVVLLAGFYLWLERTVPRPPLRLVVAACLFAGALDIVENAGLLWLTNDLAGKPLHADLFSARAVAAMSTASALKWAALALVVVFIARALYAGARREVLELSRYSLISLALGTVPLIVASQGRDLVAALAETQNGRHRALFFLTLTLWGLSAWYWSRVLLDAGLVATQGPSYRGFARHLPRALGALTLLAPVYPLSIAVAPTMTRVWMAGACVALAIVFLIFVKLRRHRMTARPSRRPAPAFALRTAAASTAFRVALGSLAISLSLFAILVSMPVAAGRFLGTVPILFIAAANTVFFGSLIVFASRTSGVALEIVAFGCAAAFSFWNDNHNVRVTAAAERHSLQDAFTAWIGELKSGAHAHDATNMPVYLVAAEGGGIRAAYWTATVLGALSDAAPDEFARHVFVVNGISGGSVGAAMYAGVRMDLPHDRAVRATVTKILRDGFLSPIAARAVTGDFLQWFVPLPIAGFDRSWGMEDALAHSYSSADPRLASKQRFESPSLNVKPSAIAGVPALMLSATHVQTGSRSIAAPFFWLSTELPDTRDFHDITGGDASLAAAVHNSARFPYVSPAGRVRSVDGADRGHVIDGGYFDTSGIEVILDLYDALRPTAASAGLTLVPVFITNGVPSAEPTAAETHEQRSEPIEILGELFAPVRGVLRTRGAHGRVAFARFAGLPDRITFGFCQSPTIGGGAQTTAKPLDPPLGWELSTPMVQALDSFWDGCTVNRDACRAMQTRLGVSHESYPCGRQPPR